MKKTVNLGDPHKCMPNKGTVGTSFPETLKVLLSSLPTEIPLNRYGRYFTAASV